MKFLCIEFINTKWYATHLEFKDPLEDSEWLVAFYTRWGLPSEMGKHKEYIRRIFELREFLIAAVENLCSGARLTPGQLDQLNEYLSLTHLFRTISEDKGQYKITTAPTKQDWKWIISEIAASFAELVSIHDPARLKHCQNPDCKWLYYDESKSKTKRWCDNTCASLMKVRRFRSKPQ